MTNLQMAEYIQGFEDVVSANGSIEIRLVDLAADLLRAEKRLNFRGLSEVVGVERAKKWWENYTGSAPVKLNEI